jgi:hypothetical protein
VKCGDGQAAWGLAWVIGGRGGEVPSPGGVTMTCTPSRARACWVVADQVLAVALVPPLVAVGAGVDVVAVVAHHRPGDAQEGVRDGHGGLFSLPLPNQRARRRNRAPGRVAVRQVAQAASTMAARRC